MRYETQGLIRSKTTLRQIWQMGFRQHAFDYGDQVASVHVPVKMADEIDSEAAFVQRAESGFVYAVINAGLEIDANELAMILLNDRDQVDYIQSLLDDLQAARPDLAAKRPAMRCPATARSRLPTSRSWH